MSACHLTMFSSVHLMRIYHAVFDKSLARDMDGGYCVDIDVAKTRAKWACKWGKDIWTRADANVLCNA